MTVSARLKSLLDENKTPHTVMSHAVAYTAQAAAAVMHVSGKEVAKTVVVRAGDTTVLAVLPAACHVNLDRLGQLLGNPVRLATEQEFSDLFPDCELGAMPPFGQLYASSRRSGSVSFHPSTRSRRSSCFNAICIGASGRVRSGFAF